MERESKRSMKPQKGKKYLIVYIGGDKYDSYYGEGICLGNSEDCDINITTDDAYLFELPNEKLPAEFSKKDIVKEIE